VPFQLCKLAQLFAVTLQQKLFKVVYLLNKGGHTTLVTSPEYRGVATIVQ
jgi:hypothetical protein